MSDLIDRHGQWERSEHISITILGIPYSCMQYRCSLCGEWSGIHPVGTVVNYCPHCGARMDEVQSDEQID